MSKISSLIRRAPKRFTAALAMIAAVIIVPAVVFAWGPTRETYTIQQPATKVTFNSITNNPSIGDERNFVGIRETTAANVWYDDMTVQQGKEYYVRMYVHNNAASSLNLVAENVTAKVNLPTTTGKSIRVDGFINSTNASPVEVYDHATFNSTSNFNLAYVSGSLKYENNVFGPNGTALPESIFTSTGAKLGYDKLDGKIPGCFEYSGYVTFKVKPQIAQTTNFTLKKLVSKHGANQWVENYTAQPSEKVDFALTYQNTGTVQHNDVTFRDTLPTGLNYVAGSTTWNNATQKNVQTSDNLVNGIGINVGSYAPPANAWIIFSATVDAKDKLKCGINTLINKGKVNTGGYAVEDTATVTVDNKCVTPTKITVCELATKKIVTINESDFNTTKYSKNLDDCKEVVKKITVCELATKKIVQINESDFNTTKYSKDLDDCKEVKKITVCELATKKIVTINESDYNTTKYSKNLDDCKAPGEIVVCELATKKTVTIKETAFDSTKYSKNLDDCKVTPPVTPPELPQTGITDSIVAVLGLGALIASVAYYVASRRALV